jgi:hypothetical protein
LKHWPLLTKRGRSIGLPSLKYLIKCTQSLDFIFFHYQSKNKSHVHIFNSQADKEILKKQWLPGIKNQAFPANGSKTAPPLFALPTDVKIICTGSHF